MTFGICLLGLVLGWVAPWGAEGQTYRATFSKANSGLEGYVEVSDGRLTVMLNISSVNASLLPAMNCTANFKYHAHNYWLHSSQNDMIGETACGYSYTGNHYDPQAACGSASGNGVCMNSKNSGCISSSNYACAFSSDRYSCEVGDWSSKYGVLTQTAAQYYWFQTSNAFEARGADMSGRSVVFHCGDSGKRAFCAPFTQYSSNSSNARANQSSGVAALEATFGSYGSIYMSASGNEFEVENLDVSSLSPVCAEGTLEVAVFNAWNATAAANASNASYALSGCDAIVGTQWDPTSSCLTKWSDSANCNPVFSTCNMTDYASRNCSASSPFNCAPGDLSGMHGSLSASANNHWEASTGLLPQLDAITAKSLALYCRSSQTLLYCAQLNTPSPSPSPTSAARPTHSLSFFFLSALVFLFSSH